jgi:hypothetical protein
MGTPANGAPYMEGQDAPQQYHGYDPRSNGLARRRTDEHDGQSSNGHAHHDRNDVPTRSNTNPDHPQLGPPKPKRSGKICGKCGEGLTGQFVRALGDTYHLECFTCHVSHSTLLALVGSTWRNRHPPCRP